MRHRYYLIIQGQRLQVHPKGTEKLKVVTSREKDQVFYRRKLTGTLEFVKEDFAHLLSVEESEDRCLELKFEIEKECSGLWQVEWKGYFSCNDVKWDRSRCTASVTPKPDDKYRQVLEHYGKAFNILEIPSKVTTQVYIDFEADFEFTHTASNVQPTNDPDTWSLFINANYYIDGTTLSRGERFERDVHFRLVRTAAFVDGLPQDLSDGGWKIVDEDVASGIAKYAKTPDIYNFKPYDWSAKSRWDDYPELLQIGCDTPYDTDRYIDVSASFEGACGDGCWNLPRDINDVRCMKVIWELGAFSFSRNRTLNDVVRFLTEKTASADLLPATDLALSKFFNDTVNYVTQKPNTLTSLLVASLSDIIGYNSSEAATKAEWSLKKLFDTLRQMFRVYWDITPEGKLRLEHESFYQLQGVQDLTVYKRELVLTDAYEYTKQEMPRYQRLTFANAANEDFAIGEIEYSGVCVTVEEGQDTEGETISEVTTDLEYLMVSGGGTGQRGFVFLLVKDGMVLSEAGDLTGTLLPNAGLSAANLVASYYTHNRVLEHGVVNGKVKAFQSVNKVKKQVPLTVPICCEQINPYARFVSTLGNKAELEQMSYNVTTGSVEFTLLHETTGKGPLELGRQFDESFDMSYN